VLHLVRANSPYTVIILFILTLGLKLQALGHPVMPVAEHGQVLFSLLLHFLHRLWGNNALAYTLFATVCIFGQALYLRFISIRHRLYLKNSYLPAFLYIVLSSLHPRLSQLTSTLISNWIIIAGIDMMLGFSRREDQPRTIYNAGFLLALAALMNFPSLALFFLLIYSLAVLRVFRPGEWIVGILGYLTPFYFAVCLAYLWNQMPQLKLWPQFGWNLPVFGKGHIYAPLLIGSAIFLLGVGSRYLSLILPRLTVSTKRGWGVLAVAGIFTAVVCTLAKSDGPIRWMSTLPVCSLFIVPALMPEKRSGFATFTFYFLIALVLFCQLALNHNITS
jgi:hypothetical protein